MKFLNGCPVTVKSDAPKSENWMIAYHTSCNERNFHGHQLWNEMKIDISRPLQHIHPIL